MRGISLRRCLWVIAVWLPFGCLFLPFTFLKEPYHPWYIDYTFPLVMGAIMFYYPANLLATGVPMLLGYQSSESAMHVAAFIQSLIISYVILKTASKPPSISDSPP